MSVIMSVKCRRHANAADAGRTASYNIFLYRGINTNTDNMIQYDFTRHFVSRKTIWITKLGLTILSHNVKIDVMVPTWSRSVIWWNNFLKHQGYDLKVDINQDNTSAINLEKNGVASAGRRSKHIDIRYFWLKDRVERGDVNIKYCPTKLMIADFFTKPLQGALLKRLKSVIMGQVSVEEFIASMSIAPK